MLVVEWIIDILPNFKQYVKCVDENKVKNPVTRLLEMVKSECRHSLCWCCKLLCAFGTEMCGGIGQGMLRYWREKSGNLVLEELYEPSVCVQVVFLSVCVHMYLLLGGGIVQLACRRLLVILCLKLFSNNFCCRRLVMYCSDCFIRSIFIVCRIHTFAYH